MVADRSVHAAQFELSPGRGGWLLVAQTNTGSVRVDPPSDWLLEQTVAWDSSNSVKARAMAVSIWWRWCVDCGLDPMRTTAADFSRFLLALQSIPKDFPLDSVIRVLPGDLRLRAGATVRQTVNHVKAFYRWAWVNGKVSVVTGQQMSNFKSPRATVSKTAGRLNPGQVATLLGHNFHPRNRLAIEWVCRSHLAPGCRPDLAPPLTF